MYLRGYVHICDEIGVGQIFFWRYKKTLYILSMLQQVEKGSHALTERTTARSIHVGLVTVIVRLDAQEQLRLGEVEVIVGGTVLCAELLEVGIILKIGLIADDIKSRFGRRDDHERNALFLTQCHHVCKLINMQLLEIMRCPVPGVLVSDSVEIHNCIVAVVLTVCDACRQALIGAGRLLPDSSRPVSRPAAALPRKKCIQ